MVDVRFEITSNDSCLAVDAICEGLSPLVLQGLPWAGFSIGRLPLYIAQ